MTSFRIAAVSMLLTLLLAASASAVDLAGQSRTYLTTRQQTDGTRLTGLYEYLDLRTGDAGNDAVSFSAGGWYRYDLQGEYLGTTDTGDLQYAYLALRRQTANAALQLGRVVVNEGTAVSQLDGAYGRTDLRGGFAVAAFGGIPLETSPDTRSGDSVYGGRLSHGLSGIWALGVSALREKNDGKDFRKEEGLDLWLRPFGKFEIMGLSSYNAESSNWMQHRYYAVLGPFAKLTVNLEASKTWYKEYFTSATMSAFAIGTLDPNEVVTSRGGSATVSATDRLAVTIDYTQYDYQVLSGSATRAGGTVSYTGALWGGGLSVHVMDGPSDQLKYDEQRIYAYRKFSAADVTVDLMHVGYAQAIKGETDAWNGSAALGYTVNPRLRLVADAEYSQNPDFNSDVRAMLTVVYTFDITPGTKKAPPAAPQKQDPMPAKGKKG